MQELGVGTFAGPGAAVAGGVLEALWGSELEQEVGRDGVGSGGVEAG